MTLEFVYQDFDPVIEIKKNITENTDNTKNVKLPVRNLRPQFKQQLQEYRVKNKWTIQDIADKTGSTVDDIDAFENGKKFPDAIILRKLQQVLNTKLLP